MKIYNTIICLLIHDDRSSLFRIVDRMQKCIIELKFNISIIIVRPTQ